MKLKYPLALLLLTTATMSTASETLTMGELEIMQQQTLILAQQARQAELQKKIRNSGDNSPGLVASGPVSHAGSQALLSGVQGVKGRMTARVQHNGATSILTAGQNWPGTAQKIASITNEGVRFSDGRTLAPGESYGNQ